MVGLKRLIKPPWILWGYSKEELHEQNILMLHPPDTRAEGMRLLQSVESGNKNNHTLLLRHKMGTP